MADVRLFEDRVLLDHGRSVARRSAPRERNALPGKGNDVPAGVETHLSVSAVRRPWCLGLSNPAASGTAPARALYTEFGWIARWPNGVLRVGDGRTVSLGSYGVASLLSPPGVVSQRFARVLEDEIEIDAGELESALILASPELVVLGAESYRVRFAANRGIVELWQATIEGALAFSIALSVSVWDVAVEFKV